MGAVYLARQLSLDRNVAVKVLLQKWSEDPQFIARFIREAYAAAQLNHHNVVQIHDIGEQRGTRFFSMEFVEGHTLSELIRQRGRLDPEEAVGYALQAARGLKFAHDSGMVHRDIKPENLLLNLHGILKVADLGLVKTPDTNEPKPAGGEVPAPTPDGGWYDDQKTRINISMGTPAYMAPEQAQNAADVDHRADIYALGGTLYTMLVGRPPFSGASAMDVITKHLTEPLTPPDRVVRGVPEYLSQVLVQMMAKRPEDRPATMDAVIASMEDFLGVEPRQAFKPNEHQIKTIENCAAWHRNASLARVRSRLRLGFIPLVAILLGVAIFVPAAPFGWVGAVGIFAVLTPALYVLVQGMSQRSYLWLRIREYLLGGRVADWLTWTVGIVLIASVPAFLGLQWQALAALIAALAVASGFHFAIDLPLAEQRRPPLDKADILLKELRRSGTAEGTIQEFVCRHSGENWEPFFEDLFGYEDKMRARAAWGTAAAGKARGAAAAAVRPRYDAWRDPIFAWLDERRLLRQRTRERRMLRKIELANLRARGWADAAARKGAQRAAEAMVGKAEAIRRAAEQRLGEELSPPKKKSSSPRGDWTREQKPETGKLADAAEIGAGKGAATTKRKHALSDEGLEGYERRSWLQRRYGGMSGYFLGPAVRFLIGALFMAGFLTWLNQNQVVGSTHAFLLGDAPVIEGDVRTDLTAAGGSGAAAAAADARQRQAARAQEQADGPKLRKLTIRGAPAIITDEFATNWLTGADNAWNFAIAGGILMLSAFRQGRLLGVFLIPTALLIVLGHNSLPGIAGVVQSTHLAAAVGILLSLVIFAFCRD